MVFQNLQARLPQFLSVFLEAGEHAKGIRYSVAAKPGCIRRAGSLLLGRALKIEEPSRWWTRRLLVIGCERHAAENLNQMSALQILAFIVLCLNFVHISGTTAVVSPMFHAGTGDSRGVIGRLLSSKMSHPSQSASLVTRGTTLALTLWLFFGEFGYAQSTASFERLAGQWSGAGTIDLSDGARESIRCRAAYDVLKEQHNLQLNIRCASDSYNFDLRASANESGGAITGSWSESTRNAAGTISGSAEGDRFHVVAKGPTLSASLTVVTRGNRQSVTIRSQDSQAKIKGASMALRRR